MRTVYAVAAAPILINILLSLTAALYLGGIDQIPMHWNTKWQVDLYAPKFIGLSIIPVFSFIALGGFLSSSYNKIGKQRIRDLVIIAFILVSAHLFHLYLIMQWVAALSS